MNPNDNLSQQSPQDNTVNSGPGTVIAPTNSIPAKELFQPTVQPAREQSQIPAPEMQPTPMQTGGQQATETKPPKKSKLLAVVIASVVILLVITVVGVLLSSSSKKPAPVNNNTQQEVTGPQPASALDVEQSNNSINQDMSTLSDQDDFPETQIDDKTLGL